MKEGVDNAGLALAKKLVLAVSTKTVYEGYAKIA